MHVALNLRLSQHSADRPIMGDTEPKDAQALPPTPQPLVGFMTNEGWDKLLAQVNAQIQEMENLPFPEVKDKVFELLAGIDAIHREALRRLVRLFKDGVLEKVVTDPAIHTLMELYDLLPPEPQASVDDKPSEKPKSKFPDIPVKIVPVARQAPQSKPKFPHWVPVLREADELASGTVKEFDIDAHQVLLCRVEDEFFAVDSHCAQDGSSLAQAALKTYTLSCSNHPGCFYDVRQGVRIAGSGELTCYPVKLEEDRRVLVGLDMPFKPALPSF